MALHLQEIEQRVGRLEEELVDLRASLDIQRSIEGVGRGLKSKAAGKSLPAREALAALRKKLLEKRKTRRTAKAR